MIIDISQPLGTRTAVWPGDRSVEIDWTMRRERGDSVNVAALLTTVHAGTHADGFLHVRDDGASIADMPLDAYIGRCVVVDARGRDEVSERDVAHLDLASVERILFRTRDHVDPTTFFDAFAPIAPALARQLGEAGVRLVGTDAPSIDPFDSKTLETHNIFAEHAIANLENLVLNDVAPGEYTLIALPLRLEEADSSPVRAVLMGWGEAEKSAADN